jgi:hypothetical protein
MGSLWRRRVASVGVPRQECGTAGKVESGQIGIFLGSPDLRHLARAWVPGPALLLARGLGTRCAGPRPRSPRGSLPDQATARHRQAGARLGAGGAEVRGEVLAVLSPTPVGTKRPPGVRPSRSWGAGPDQGGLAPGAPSRRLGRWSPAGRPSPGRSSRLPRASRGHEDWGRAGSSSRATDGLVPRPGSSGSPSEPAPMGCPPRPPLPQRSRRPRLLPGPD